MTHRCRSHAGLTLIEVLAALVILAGVVSVGGSWTIGLTKTAARTAATSQETSAQFRLLAVLERDLDQSIADSVKLADNGFELITLHRPGEPVPAWNRVRWQFDTTTKQLTRLAPSRDSDGATPMHVHDLVTDWIATLEAPKQESDAPDELTIAIRFQSGKQQSITWRRPK